jgi:hypothetical protein
MAAHCTFQAANGTAPYYWSIASGSLPPGLPLDSGLGKVSGIPSSAGNYNFVLRVEDNSTPPESTTAAFSILIEPEGGTLEITTTSLTDGSVGAAYSEPLTAIGGIIPYTWSISSGSLPDGLNLNSSTGVISGTPASDGTSNFTVRVTDNGAPVQETTESFSIVIAPLEITTASLPNGTVASPYSATLQVKGGSSPYTWSVTGSLPGGLNLNSGTGEISGTPASDGTFDFTVTVTDNAGNTDSKPFSITVTSGGGPGNWGAPVALPKPAAGDTPNAAPGQPCKYPDIEAGSAIYVGFGVSKPDGDLMYTFCTASIDGTSWATPHRLALNSYQQQPRMAKDSGGKAHILTSEQVGGAWRFYHITTTDGASYSEETVADGEYHAWLVDIAIDNADDIHIAWQSDNDYGNGHPSPVYKKCTSGSWGSRMCLITEEWRIRYPRITADHNNNPYVVIWDGTYPYYFTSLNGGSTWSSEKRIVSHNKSSKDTELVADSNNKVHMVWSDAEGVHHLSGNQDSWSAPKNISGGNASTYCGLAIDSQDTLHVVFDGVYYTKSTDSGTTWSTPVCISGGSGEMPSIAVDSSSQLHAVWSSGGEIYYCRTE